MALIKNLRSNLENPNTPLTPEILGSFFLGSRTHAGVRVNEANAMHIPAVFACVRIISEGLACLPCKLFERTENGRQEAAELPLFYLLRYSPNPQMTAFTFFETMQGHLCLWGNAYAEIQRDNAGRVIALWPRHPARTKPYRNEAGDLYYEVHVNNNSPRIVTSDNMLHIRGLSDDGILGISPISQARQAMGLAIATEKFGAQFFGNGSRPGGVLSHPKTLKEDAAKKLKESWQQSQGGDNAHTVAVLEEGIKWEAIGINPADSQFLETRKFQKSEIAGIFRVPPHLIGDLERSTHSNIEQQSLEFVIYTMLPWLVRWEQEITLKLLPSGKPHGSAIVGRNAAKTYFVEFSVNALIRGDFQSRTAGYAIARQWGWMSANDVREQEGQNPIGAQGDIYLVPMNMIDAELVSAPPDGSGLPGAKQLPASVDDSATADNTSTDTNDTNSRMNQQHVNRFVAGYFRIFRSALSASLNIERAKDKTAMYRLFAPVLISLAEMFAQQACSELRVEPLPMERLNTLVTEHLERMTLRSAKWDEATGDAIAKDELGKAVRSLSIAAYQEAATQKAKRITTTP
jgi:HK97 family phage portal protein